MEEDFKEAPKVLKPFAGTGNVLGGPSTSSAAPASSSMPGSFPSTSAAPAEPRTVSVNFAVDESLPTTSIQIRLADGTRLVSKFNHSHRVSDIRGFVNAYVILQSSGRES